MKFLLNGQKRSNFITIHKQNTDHLFLNKKKKQVSREESKQKIIIIREKNAKSNHLVTIIYIRRAYSTSILSS